LKILTSNSIDVIFRHLCGTKNTVGHHGDLKLPFDELSLKLGLEFIEYELEFLVPPLGGMKSKAEISLDIYKSLDNLSPLRLVDARFWTTLALQEFGEFSQARWPEVEKDRVIRNHWFASTSRDLHREHVISSEWWVGSISQRISTMSDLSPLTASGVINSNADFRSSLLSRPRIFSSTQLASGIVKLLSEELIKGAPYKRLAMRAFLAEVNFKMGRRSLFSLTQGQVDGELKLVWDEVYAP
jgi:hypothetical protein